MADDGRRLLAEERRLLIAVEFLLDRFDDELLERLPDHLDLVI